MIKAQVCCDCVSRGTISPMEAYDCLKLGYILENLKTREGYYQSR